MDREELNYSPAQIRKLTHYLDELFIEDVNKVKHYLTPKQRCFAWHFVFNGNNKTDAYKRAYLSIYKDNILVLTEKGQTIENQRAHVTAWLYYRSIIVQQAIILIQKEVEKEIRIGSPNKLLQQLYHEATYNPFDLITDEGKLKPISEIPEELHHIVAGLKKNYHGKDADVSVVEVSLADRKAARKEMMKLCPGMFEPEKIELIHKTIDKDGKEIGIDYSKATDEELLVHLKRLEGKR